LGTTLKITTIGNSVGIVLPKQLLSHMHVQKGDPLHVTKPPEGFQISPYAEEFAAKWRSPSGSLEDRRTL
jgi:putative addiction module antidote